MTVGYSSGRIIVTGASRGIGRAVVAALIARRGRVVAVARDQKALESVSAIDPSRVRPVVADLDDPGARDSVVPRAVELLGGVDGLVNCAGISRHAPLGSVTEGDVQAQLSTNLLAPILLSQAAALRMRRQRTGGAIVNVASTLGIRPAPATVAYAASKAGLLAVTRAMACELAGDAIRVNAVAPGVVETDMARAPRNLPGEHPRAGAARKAQAARQAAELTRLHPLGRLGRPEDVAQAILYLLDSTWTTGTVLTIDGGLMVRE
jgi:NAD(P)-dependent dehydrogenase (short-subunit alcohol dehydrogenase family)